jgi:NitT/TauT family transport system permease protein
MRQLRRTLDHFAPAATFIVILLVWELGCRLGAVPSFVLPKPSDIVLAGFNVGAGQWLSHLWATLQIVLIGYVLSIVISIPLAVLLTNSRLLSRTIVPMLVIVQSTPIVAIAPIIVVTLGADILPRVVITCLITFFPLVVSTTTGLRATPEELIELSRSLRASRWREYVQIRLPFAIPYIFSALKVCVTLAVIGAVVAEFVAAQKGLGYLILYATSLFKVPQAFAALAILVCVSLLLYQLVVFVERALFPWSLPRGGQS